MCTAIGRAPLPSSFNQGVRSPLAQFNARMEQWADEIKAVPTAKGFDEVFYPGEIEANNDRKNRTEGILFPDDTLADLKRIGKDAGLDSKLPL